MTDRVRNKGDKEKLIKMPRQKEVESRMDLMRELPSAQKAKALIDDSRSRALVRGMPVEELHYLIRDIGEDEAVELIALASPEQINQMLDLELWYKEFFLENRFKEWLEMLSGISVRKALTVLLSMERQSMILFLKRVLNVIRRPDDIDPLEFISADRYSPDNLYYIEFINEAFSRETIEPILDHLYGYDQELFVDIMDYLLMEQDVQLEEDAYRLRKGRLEDRGFPDHYEALEIFSYVDPVKILKEVEKGRKIFFDEEEKKFYLTETLKDDSFLAAVLREKSAASGISSSLQQEIAFLCHRVMAAENIDFRKSKQIKAAFAAAYGYLNIGLEYLSQGDVSKAVDLLDRIYVKRIFQAAFSLTLDLKKRARALLTHWNLLRKDGGIYLFDPDYNVRLAALMNPKPFYYVDSSKEPGRVRVFWDYSEVVTTQDFLERAEALCFFFFNRMGLRLTDFFQFDFSCCLPSDRREIYFSHLLLTALARHILGLEAGFAPVKEEVLDDLHQKSVDSANNPPVMKPEIIEEIKFWLAGILTAEELEVIWSFVLQCISIFNENFAPVKADRKIDPKYIKGIIVEL